MTILLTAALLGVAVLGAQAQPDDRPGRDREPHHYALAGAFDANRTEEDLRDFDTTVQEYTDDYVLMESFPEQFRIHGLDADECRALRADLDNKTYIARLSECRADDDDADDGRPDRDHPRDKRPQGRALGHDREWHECRTEAGDNETQKRECHDAAMERARERHDAIREAREQHRIGGELNISRGEHRIDNASGVMFDVMTASEDDPEEAPEVRVEVDADLDRGQTIVLDVDPDLFDGLDDLVVAYFDIAEDGTETEVPITKADSLDDVLDPDNDDGPEYWAVEDPEGLHVLVSIPSWSVHAVELHGSAIGAGEDIVGVPGVGVVALGITMAGLVLLARRRG